MRLELNDFELIVYGYLATTHVPWGELESVTVDYGGLRLNRTDGSVLTAASMGKPNWATWLHRRVAADDRVEVIRREMLRHRRSGGE